MTIIKDDNFVGIDGVFHKVDLEDLPSNFHALQWYGDQEYGEIEWNGFPKPPNTILEELGEYSIYVDKWNEVREQIELAIAQVESANTGT
jgi:hypothetical protein